MAVLQRLRRAIWAFRIVCVIVLALGVAGTVSTHNEHWVERSGKVIVALALMLTYLQFRYEVRHAADEKMAHERAEQLLQGRQLVSPGQKVAILDEIETTIRTRYDADRSYILLNALAAAAVGELVSAFGSPALQLLS